MSKVNQIISFLIDKLQESKKTVEDQLGRFFKRLAPPACGVVQWGGAPPPGQEMNNNRHYFLKYI